MEGTRIGPYEVVRALGAGGFARTWEARHTVLGERACLKVGHLEADDDLLLREGRILWGLHHPSLPTLRDVLRTEEGALCLGVMMHRLRMLLDVYVETEGEGGGSAAVCGTMCSRRVRGRDRRKPFVFDARSGQFDRSR